MHNDPSVFREIVDESMVGVLLANLRDFKLSYANKTAQQILDLTFGPGGFQVRLLDLFPEYVRKSPPLTAQELFALEGMLQEITMLRVDGSVILATVGLKRLTTEAAGNLMVMFQDVSAEKKLERDIELKQKGLRDALKELSDKNRALEILDEAKTRFISLVTHELRTPLTALLTSAEFLLGDVYDNREDEVMLKRTLFSQANLLLEIVNDVLDVTKIKAGHMEYYVSEADLVPLLEDSMRSFGELSGQKSLRLERSGLNSATCYFDSIRMRQVIGNLLSNAIKFSPKAGVIRLTLEIRDLFVTLGVHDQGPGIPKDKQHMLFTEFGTIGDMAVHSQGTGLGLVICKSMMEAMGGRIHYTCPDGGGTSFFIELPTTRVLPPECYRTRSEGGLNLLDEIS